MKKRRQDLLFGMLIALSLHIAAGIGIGTLAALHREVALPVFRKGESAVELTLEPVPVVERQIRSEPPEEDLPDEPLEEEPEPEMRHEPDPEPEPEEIAVEDQLDPPREPQEKEEQVPQPRVADLEEKGVETLELGKTSVNPTYPLGAQMRGEEGVVRVQFKVVKDGSVRDVRVVKSSGYSALDNAAVDAVRRASFQNFAGLPSQGSVEELTIKFELRER